MKHDIASDATYNAGLPDFTEDEITAIYAKAGVDIVTGLPISSKSEIKDMYDTVGMAFSSEPRRFVYEEDCVISVGPDTKPTGGKVALASGNLSAGVLAFDAPIWAIVKSAKACNCMSCHGMLENIKSAAMWNKSNLDMKRPTYQSMTNVRYFIHRLREIVLSRNVKHNVK